MSNKTLPIHPHLSHLKKQAKELLAEVRSKQESAIERVNHFHPAAENVLGTSDAFCLAESQLVLAREYGFESWPKLRAHVEAVTGPNRDRTELNRALDFLRNGKLCILFDDESRENEGDLVLAAEKVTPEAINFITKHGRGTLCLSLISAQANQLGLRLVNSERKDLSQPAFMVSIDAAQGVTSGVSAFDRAQTILTAISIGATPESVRSPGHIFPLLAHPDGIRGRRGHTEGSIELMKRAGLKPAAVICEILNEDGTMARLPDLLRVGRELNLPVVQISDLIN